MKRKTAGIIVIAGAALYGFAETRYFGDNWWPQSAAECVCDGMTLLLSAVGGALLYARKLGSA